MSSRGRDDKKKTKTETNKEKKMDRLGYIVKPRATAPHWCSAAVVIATCLRPREAEESELLNSWKGQPTPERSNVHRPWFAGLFGGWSESGKLSSLPVEFISQEPGKHGAWRQKDELLQRLHLHLAR